MKKLIIISIIINLTVGFLKANETIYICTGANSKYFSHLLNFIGSLHKTNFDSLKEVMVFDFGLTVREKKQLESIKKTVVCNLEKTHPDILKFFTLPSGHNVLGWFAWKPVALHQALQKYQHVIWMDAGTTVLGPLDDLMNHVIQNGYFLITSGDEFHDNQYLHSLGWSATEFIRKKFNLAAAENSWILDQENVMGGLNGISREAYNLYLQDWYEASYDLRNFADDGTTPHGYGTGRHDQTYLSILAYMQGLHICKQDYTQETPTILHVDNKEVPFYITWNPKFISNKTQIYNSRGDIRGYEKYIHYK